MAGWWGLGAIVRNEQGLVMAAATWRIPGIEDALTAKAYALLLTLRLAIECGFRSLTFEVDSEKVSRLVNSEKQEDRSYLGQIIGAIRNKLAHALAHLAHSNPDRIWIEEVPPEVVEVYYRDILN